MLNPETPYPQVGSYCLVEHERELQLARIVELPRSSSELALISLPLRADAGGMIRIDPGELIDASPLTAAEQLELRDLNKYLGTRTRYTRKQMAAAVRRLELRQRITREPILQRLLRQARARSERKAA